MTLSVFRQLPREDLIDPQGILAGCEEPLHGAPWGRVRYCPGDCQGDGAGEHLHVVWEKDGVLRQARVPRVLDRSALSPASCDGVASFRGYRGELDALALAGFLAAGMRRRGTNVPDGGRTTSGFWFSVPPPKNRVGDWVMPGAVPPSLRSYWEASNPELTGPLSGLAARVYEVRRGAVLADLRNALGDARVSARDPAEDNGADAEVQCGRLYPSYRRRLKRLLDGWAEQYRRLAALEQLFIAV
jgi:hypothetical protein